MKLGNRQVKLLKDTLFEKQFHENVRCQACILNLSRGRGDFQKKVAKYL